MSSLTATHTLPPRLGPFSLSAARRSRATWPSTSCTARVPFRPAHAHNDWGSTVTLRAGHEIRRPRARHWRRGVEVRGGRHRLASDAMVDSSTAAALHDGLEQYCENELPTPTTAASSKAGPTRSAATPIKSSCTRGSCCACRMPKSTGHRRATAVRGHTLFAAAPMKVGGPEGRCGRPRRAGHMA